MTCEAGALFANAGGDHDLPGWQGEIYQGSGQSSPSEPRDESQWIETVSWEPRAFVYHNFLSKEECLHLIHLAAPTMEKSSVVDNKTGKSVASRIRTSSGTFLNRGHDKVVKDIEERLASFSMIPADHGEGLQVLHYEVGQQYEAHYDFFHDKFNVKNGGQRIATVLMYLADVEDGGETVFPQGKPITPQTGSWSPCAQQGVAVKPKRGDAMVFWSLKTDGNTDNKSLHASCPVIKGNKWTATKWLRVNKYTI
ncbi:hypothetical protein CYMTET_20403 [Cymbomonas tetramitiformis]|uniref:procollagen-proline 4-dioxygenase n=1 Tax=Cymbomonas tetramitiformis TaxID=36881 RepID=A0AAE0G5I0_9CHLO|nr:hypothetical protein CYMTET_20403 [Cymbomonas tetramitiformis]